MKIDIPGGLNNPRWSEGWHSLRNKAVEELAAGGSFDARDDISCDREDSDDANMRWLFWYLRKRNQGQSDRLASPDATLYEGVTRCMENARNNERQRIAKAISNGLRTLLGDEFHGIMFDIAELNGINIGRD